MSVLTRSMRLITSLVLVLLMLAACGQQDTGGDAAAETPDALISAAETSAPPNADEATTPVADTSETAVSVADSTPDTSVATSAPDAAAGGSSGPIAVGSKDFTEEFIVAEMYALLLENNGFEVDRKLNLGGTPITQQAIVNGEIDLYPEYTSTGLLTVLQQEPIKDANEIVETVRSGYEEQFNLTWLDPAPFNNTQALATTRAIAEQYNLATYSDLATAAPELRLGGPPEFAEREDGINGLQQEYGGFEFKEYVQLGTGPLRYDALAGGQIDVVVAFGTDGRIGADELVVLQDDKSYYPIYQIAPVVRQDTLEANPGIADALNQLAPLLTDEVMSKLNARVDVDGEQYELVAEEFLKEQGLIQ